MQPRDMPINDLAPTADVLTAYDRQHLTTYIRLLDAESSSADWKNATRTILDIDAAREPDRARRAWESHLARARWMTETGYRNLAAEAASR